MPLFQPVQCSRAWYDFVKNTALKDDKVVRLAKDYISAINKLNARLVELAKKDPALKGVSFSDDHDGHEFVVPIQQFHEFHGVHYSAEELVADARSHEITTFSVDIHG